MTPHLSLSLGATAPRPGGPLAEVVVHIARAAERRDAAQLRAMYEATYLGSLPPLRLLDLAARFGRDPVRAYFEAWDGALQRVWLADDGPEDGWRDVLLPQGEGYPLGHLLVNALFLREAGSSLVEDVPPWPLAPGAHALAAQARRLGRALVRADARTPCPYDALASTLHPELLPALATWFLGTYLLSPLESVDPAVIANRRQALDGFVKFHTTRRVALPPVALLGGSGPFGAAALATDPGAFLAALSDGVLAPALDRLTKLASVARRPAEDASPCGVVLTAWREGTAVQRCVGPLVEGLRRAGAHALHLAENPAQGTAALPPAWRDGPARLATLPAASTPDLAHAARRVRALDLDFLFYPEVGLTLGSRWLASQRLARVQAAGYGHPVTTGSSAIDYFVGGAAVESDGRAYRERLVLLPGLGVSSTVPPAPRAPRRRPVAGEAPRLVTMAGWSKFTPELLAAWNRVLGNAGPGATLQLVPALPASRVDRVAAAIEPYFTDGDAVLTPELPRQDCVDTVAEADVYLDSFPFGGYNTLVEALATGCPVVTLEGAHAYGRFGAAMLRTLDLPSFLVATTPEEYVAAATRLARDAALRGEIRAMLTRERVVAALCRDDMAAHFDAAVAWMRAEGPGRAGPPVYIEAGAAPRVSGTSPTPGGTP